MMNVVRTAVRSAVAISVAALALSGCSSSSSSNSGGGGSSGGSTKGASAGTYKFGLVTSSSGPFASNYATMVAGAKYAQKIINDAGGVNGAKIDFVTVDIQNDPKNAVTQVPKLATSDNVLAIVGPVDSAGCDIVCTTANKLKVPTVSPGAGRPGVLEHARPYAFTLAQPDADNSTPVLEKAVKERGFKTAAIITDDTNATTEAQRALYEKVFSADGVKVAKKVTFAAGDPSLTSQVTAMKSVNPDVIALAAGPDDAGRIAQEIRSQGLKATLIGTGSLQSGGAAYFAAGKTATEGTVSAAQYDPTDPTEPAKSLLAKAQTDTGQAQIPLNFAYAYDAVNMIVKVIKAKNIKPGDNLAKARTAIEVGLNNLGTYEGMAAKTSFKSDGTAIRPQLEAVLTNGEFVIQHSN
jgi:branched-chain amino acid transport system substrate-binding protein